MEKYGFNEIINSLEKYSYSNKVYSVLLLLLDLDFDSITNYREEQLLNEAIDDLYEDELLTFKEILDFVFLLDIDFCKKVVNELNINTENIYITELLNNLKGRLDGVSEFKTEDEQVNLEVEILISELAMVMIRELKFNNKNDKIDNDILLQAIKEDNVQMVKAFYTNGELDISVRDYYNESLIHFVVIHNSPKLIHFFSDLGVSINHQNDFLQTPLHLSILHNSKESFYKLIELGVNVNISDEQCNTPLHLACFKGDIELVKAILDNGGNSSLKNKEKLTPIEIAIKQDHDVIVRFLLKQRVNRRKIGVEYELINKVAMFNSIKVFNVLKELNYNVLIKDKDGFTPLHIAAIVGNIEVAELFISSGVNINEYTNEGLAAIHYAAIYGHEQFISFLIEKNIDVNIKSKNNLTTLGYAVYSNNFDICKYLIEQGADLNYKDRKKNSLLHYAVEMGSVEVAKLLITSGADVNAQNKVKATPLLLTVINNNIELAKILIELGADINLKCILKTTPLHMAVKENKFEIAKLLIEYGANVNLKNVFGFTPLHLIKADNVDMVKLLIDSGADVNKKSIFLQTPISDVSCRRHKESYTIMKSKLKTKNKIPLYCWLIFVLFLGLSLIYINSRSIYNQVYLYSQGSYITGEITETRFKDKKYQVKYEFKVDDKIYSCSNGFDVDNMWFTVTKNDYKDFEVGSSVKIKYFTKNPWFNYAILESKSEKEMFTNKLVEDSLYDLLGLIAVGYALRRYIF